MCTLKSIYKQKDVKFGEKKYIKDIDKFRVFMYIVWIYMHTNTYINIYQWIHAEAEGWEFGGKKIKKELTIICQQCVVCKYIRIII